jgi:tetratricopeptide (TPR) repeat protein
MLENYYRRATWRIRAGDFDNAASDLAKARELNPALTRFWKNPGIVCLFNLDQSRYEAWCQEMCNGLQESTDELTRVRVARLCSLGVECNVDRESLYRMSDELLREDGKDVDKQVSCAMAAYRVGKWETVLDVLRDASRIESNVDRILARLFVAMAYGQQEELELAERELDEARNDLDACYPGRSGQGEFRAFYPIEWCELQIVLREAEELIEG